MPSADEDYEFDRVGHLLVKDALSPLEVEDLNAAFDRFPVLGRGEWLGNAQRRDYTDATGFELHNLLDCGDPTFDRLIDHPSWIAHARHYAGEEGTYVEGVTIDESVASVRGPGGHHPVHSGGHDSSVRTQYGFRDGRFRCGQLNVLIALTDIGSGDGATMVVPASHKSNLPHPRAGNYDDGDRMDALPGAVEVHARAGDVLLFVDSLMHGGALRTNPGERRVIILRYGPRWASSRYGYTYSHSLLDRLSAARRRVLQPRPPTVAGDPTIPTDDLPLDSESDTGATHPTSPDGHDLDGLVDRFAGAASFEVSGRPARAVDPVIGLVAYRVAKEALNNTLKHAAEAIVAVAVEYRADHFTVSIVDDGGIGAAREHDSTGVGLAGLVERVRSVGGSIESGPREGDGFEVRASLPYTPPNEGLADAGNAG